MMLKPLQLTKELTTDVEIIDRQHGEFFRRANLLLKKCDTSNALNEKDITETLDFIWIYVIEHFSAEEDLMKRYDYQSIDEHMRAHSEFRKNYMNYREVILRSGIKKNTMKEIMLFMRDWFFSHIKTHDMKLSKFIKSEVKVNSGLKAKLTELVEKFFPVS